MSHSVYASQSTSTLRIATGIMTDVGNNKQKCSSDGAFQHGVTWSKFKHCRDTFQKFKAERECYKFSLTSFQEPGTWRAAHWASRKHHAVFVPENDGGCFVVIEKPRNVQKVHRYNTKTKYFLHSCLSLALHLVPISTLNKLFGFLTR